MRWGHAALVQGEWLGSPEKVGEVGDVAVATVACTAAIGGGWVLSDGEGWSVVARE
jgi:hypothetical protein